jgi:uncharacterized membrane protein
MVGTATVIGGFVGRLPSFVAVLLHNVTRGDAHSAWGHSHCQWQSHTCWCTVLRVRRGAVVGVPIRIALTLGLMGRLGRGGLRRRDPWPLSPLCTWPARAA